MLINNQVCVNNALACFTSGRALSGKSSGRRRCKYRPRLMYSPTPPTSQAPHGPLWGSCKMTPHNEQEICRIANPDSW